jgi:hypothetical protein
VVIGEFASRYYSMMQIDASLNRHGATSMYIFTTIRTAIGPCLVMSADDPRRRRRARKPRMLILANERAATAAGRDRKVATVNQLSRRAGVFWEAGR